MHDTQQSLVNGDSGNGGDVGNERGNNRNGDDGVLHVVFGSKCISLMNVTFVHSFSL